MHKFRKILLLCALLVTLAFTFQKTTNYYIERQINTYLAPYKITAELSRLNKLKLTFKGISLNCKIKIEDGAITLTPMSSAFFLPDKITIPIKFSS